MTTTADRSLAAMNAWMESHPAAGPFVGLAAVLVVAILAWIVTRYYLLRALERIIRKSEIDWDDALLEKDVLRRAAFLAPMAVLWYGIDLIPGIAPRQEALLSRLTLALLVFLALRTFSAALTAANHIYSKYPVSRGRPIKGYLQIVKIFAYVIGIVFVIAFVLGRSPLYFVTGIGAMTAVILLIFRDTILSFVASIQIVSNDMVRIGDWIQMEKYGADGDVVDIALHTVKVQNWDKTITTIPTYKLIEDSFKNWRGMKESGGRRIKRAIHIDMSSVHFLEKDDIERYSRFVLLRDYMQRKVRELEEYNASRTEGTDLVANARRLTNIGTFRAYLVEYLQQHPDVHAEGMTFLVRHLQPGPQGLPLEIYVFTRTTAWVEYESIQADIFDHILAIIPEFGLRVFQEPTGSDFGRFMGDNRSSSLQQ